MNDIMQKPIVLMHTHTYIQKGKCIHIHVCTCYSRDTKKEMVSEKAKQLIKSKATSFLLKDTLTFWCLLTNQLVN